MQIVHKKYSVCRCREYGAEHVHVKEGNGKYVLVAVPPDTTEWTVAYFYPVI